MGGGGQGEMKVRRCEGKARDRQSGGTHRKSSLFLWIIAQAGPSQYCPSACLFICLSFHLKMVLNPCGDTLLSQWARVVCPPPEASRSAPHSISAYFPHRTAVKKLRKKKKRKKSHHHEWVTITAGKIHGEHWWEGASSLPGQLATTVSYLHCSQTLCTAQSE